MYEFVDFDSQNIDLTNLITKYKPNSVIITRNKIGLTTAITEIPKIAMNPTRDKSTRAINV
jgi:hypothetical protein